MAEPLPLPGPLTAVAERLLNERLRTAPPEARARLAGRAIAVRIEPPGIAFSLIGAADRLQVVGGIEEPADVQLAGSPLALAAALGRDDRSGLTLAGDAAVLSDLRHALNAAEHDWEVLFERIAGVGAAAPVRRLLEGTLSGLRHGARRGAEDVVDYARDEAGWLPPGGAFEAFAEDVADLRDDVARLEARLRRIETGGATPDDDRQG
ncbi:MAG: ubiquinone biosynthesis accessory factor UbiJ [Pseudomonadota bacterium]